MTVIASSVHGHQQGGHPPAMPSHGQQPEAISQLYQQHRRWLLAWLRMRVHDSAMCEDIVQDAFLQLLVHGDLAAIKAPQAMLLTMVKHLMVSRYRRQCLEETYLSALALEPLALAPSAEQQCMLQQSLARLDGVLGSLSQQVRAAFVGYRVDGLKLVEVAQQLGVSPTMARRYVLQAASLCAADGCAAPLQ